MSTGLIRELAVAAFRSIQDVTIAPEEVCALVGEAQAGKSNLLAAIRAILDPVAPLADSDSPSDGDGTVLIRAQLSSGAEITLSGTPAAARRQGDAAPLAVVFLPAVERGGELVAETDAVTAEAARVLEIFRAALGERRGSTSTQAASILDAVQACCVRGVVLLVEEPELYLRPQAQRYLYRELRRFAGVGNQVIYSTHSPAFLNVARLDELVFVERRGGDGTRAMQPQPVSPDHDFRVLSEFDAERAELFLARAALLVEGQTEKLAFPFDFESFGHDADGAGISVVECGGKWNIPLFARICDAAGVPAVAVYDRDARPGRRPSAASRAVAAQIRALVGAQRTIELEPDFEAVAGIHTHGKPERAWRTFATRSAAQMPAALARAAELAVELAVEPAHPTASLEVPVKSASTPWGLSRMAGMSTTTTTTRGYEATKKQLLSRLARIEGQVRGIARMVEEDRYCIDVITQVSAIHAALDKVSLALLDGHARVCMAPHGAAAESSGEQVDELMDAVGRLLGR